jgi:hypothetical protein
MNTSYKLLKLNNGEDLVCRTEEILSLKDRENILIYDPMILTQIRMPYGGGIIESYTLSPWLALAENEFYELPVQYIMVFADVKDKLKANYIQYVESRKEIELKEDSDENEEPDPFLIEDHYDNDTLPSINTRRRKKYIN